MERPQRLDDAYEKLVRRMDNPRVVIDNEACSATTVIKVDSARKSGVLLEAVQALTDLNLSIRKAYISCDGRWFMDVFHVTDQFGEKLVDDDGIRAYIEQSLVDRNDARTDSTSSMTALELTGSDRPGTLSEVFAVLSDLRCNVMDARVWTHNGRIASLMHVRDEDSSGSVIQDDFKLHRIQRRLRNVLKGDADDASAVAAVTTASSVAAARAEHRLHQIMSLDRDTCQSQDSPPPSPSPPSASSPSISVQNWIDRGYSIVNVQCRDRPKLFFDILCNLTDMDYVVFHATVDTVGDQAFQEYYIRQTDGNPIGSEAGRQRLIQCLKSGVERRSRRGARLELSTGPGVLSEATRVIRENGLFIAEAEVAAAGTVFYVVDVAGEAASAGAIEAVQKRIRLGRVVVEQPRHRLGGYGRTASCPEPGGSRLLLYIGALVRRNLFNLGLVRSIS
ncbi:ACT domain-containing protein ACR8-like [Wolffia australiana]